MAIAALISCPTLAEAARSAGIAEKTLWRWLQVPEFQACYRSARQEVVSQAIALIQGCMGAAVNTLKTVAGDDQAPPSARVAAARAILDLGLRVVEIEDLAERIERLEAIISRQKEGGN